nr:hypothetical protein CFP56_06056 [Quercus suber]
MSKLYSLLYTNGFRYGVLRFLINESSPYCSAYCIKYGVSYRVCCVTVLTICKCMLYCVMSVLYKRICCLQKCLLF